MANARKDTDSTVTGSIGEELRAAGIRATILSQPEKKNYAERLSRNLAARVAQQLRPTFPTVLPGPDGKGQESFVRSSKGYKKLDVNYSTAELGLGLGVSIKTINFPDGKSGRYTKNYTRADGELRAEATDYHDRQPFAVMVAMIFLPLDCCDDGNVNSKAPSSFGYAVQTFRFRAGRQKSSDLSMLFERVFIGLYETDETNFGEVVFFDVMEAPPKRGRPVNVLTFEETIDQIIKTYDARNSPSFQWADAPPETVSIPAESSEDEEE